MRKFYVTLKAVDRRGVQKEITYEAIKANDVAAAAASAIEAAGISLGEVTYIYVSEKR